MAPRIGAKGRGSEGVVGAIAPHFKTSPPPTCRRFGRLARSGRLCAFWRATPVRWTESLKPDGKSAKSGASRRHVGGDSGAAVKPWKWSFRGRSPLHTMYVGSFVVPASKAVVHEKALSRSERALKCPFQFLLVAVASAKFQSRMFSETWESIPRSARTDRSLPRRSRRLSESPPRNKCSPIELKLVQRSLD